VSKHLFIETVKTDPDITLLYHNYKYLLPIFALAEPAIGCYSLKRRQKNDPNCRIHDYCLYLKLEIRMTNIEPQIESSAAPQRKPNLDMTSHIAGLPASQARNGDADAPAIRVPLPPVPW
jgi:hypothetical protein